MSTPIICDVCKRPIHPSDIRFHHPQTLDPTCTDIVTMCSACADNASRVMYGQSRSRWDVIKRLAELRKLEETTVSKDELITAYKQILLIDSLVGEAYTVINHLHESFQELNEFLPKIEEALHIT